MKLTWRRTSFLAIAAAIVMSTFALFMQSQPVQAATDEEIALCRSEIEALRAATLETTSFKNTKDQLALDAKLGEALAKLDQGKFGGAVQKLTDFRSKVVALSDQGKIDPADAASLIAGADAAIACVQSLSAP